MSDMLHESSQDATADSDPGAAKRKPEDSGEGAANVPPHGSDDTVIRWVPLLVPLYAAALMALVYVFIGWLL